jgi:hypothetical protein
MHFYAFVLYHFSDNSLPYIYFFADSKQDFSAQKIFDHFQLTTVQPKP